MYRKLYSQQAQDLDVALRLLHASKVLLDYAPIFPEAGGFSQIVRVKCDDAALSNLISKKFKKKIKIIK